MKNVLRLNSIGAMAVRILFAVVAAFPIVFMLVSSLKPDQQIFGDMSSVAAFLPIGNISLDNYTAVFDRVPAARFLINSVGISAVTVVLGIFVNSLCAFALSRMQVRGKRVVFTAILATLIVSVPDAGAAAGVVGEPAAVLRTQRFQPGDLQGLAGHLPGADHPVHRQRVLHLPVPPVLRVHPEGTGRGSADRRRRLVQNLPPGGHAARRARPPPPLPS